MGTVSTTLPSDGQTIDASDVNTPINAILSEFNGNIDDNNIKTGANINGAKILASSLPGSALDTTLAGGWISGGLPAVSSVTNNGNRSETITFASTVASLLSPGMRLRTTRTVSAPTQCADLEASSSQYFSSASAGLAGMTFTDDFTCMGWVKLESYAQGTIIGRYSVNGYFMRVDATGQLVIAGGNGGAIDYATTYQSLPLNKWVHVAATLDISGAASTMYIDGVLVPSSYTNSAATSVTQSGDFCVGALSGGSSFFDGKLAQVAVFSSVLSASTIRSYMSQGLAGNESTLVSAFSCNNSLLDLNTTNNNDLTANGGAVMTNADSPFANATGVPSGTTDVALVMAVSGSDATVQVPEGCTIPTSGGVSAVAYSTSVNPYGWVADKGRWEVSSLIRYAYLGIAIGGVSQWFGSGQTLTVPVGAWEVGYEGVYGLTSTVSGSRNGGVALRGTATHLLANADYAGPLSAMIFNGGLSTGSWYEAMGRSVEVSLSAAEVFTLCGQIASATGTETWEILGTRGISTVFANPAGI